jgi:hypothetical protein
MRIAIYFAMACLAAFLAIPQQASAQSAGHQDPSVLRKVKWLDGKWTGVGYQEAMKAEWDIVLDCATSEGKIHIIYPSISCKGEWQLQHANNFRAEFLEVIKEEQDNCGDVVRVVVTRIDERFVSVAFFLPEVDDAVAAYTVLTRVQE